MIRLSSSAVITVHEDGTRRSFEFDELQSRLYQSCLSCGINDGTLAEDITLSVEYVLKKISEGGRVFAVSEINNFVVRMLEEAGYPELADSFIRQNKIQRLDVKPDFNLISGIVSKHLAVEGEELQSIVLKVVSSCGMLGMDKASPSLILELARYYREKSFDLRAANAGLPKLKSDSPWCLRNEDIFSSLSLETRRLVSGGVLSASHVSRLFPSLKIELNLAAAAGHFSLGRNLTELAILPCLQACSAGVNEISSVAGGLYLNYLNANGAKSADIQLPVFARLNEIAVFSDKYLDARWPESHACVNEMAAMLAGMLENGITLRSLPSTDKGKL
ncbi:MAG: hypothetical protein WAX69_04365 [Victivallales bacterium]